MKKLVILFLFLASVANAQIHTTILTSKSNATPAHGSNVSLSRKSNSAPQSLSFSMSDLTESVVFQNDSLDHPFFGNFTNLTDTLLLVSFHRFQNLPYGWWTSICFGGNCLRETIDTPTVALHTSPFVFQPHESQQFILH